MRSTKPKTKPKTKAGGEWKPGLKPNEALWFGEPYTLKHPRLLPYKLVQMHKLASLAKELHILTVNIEEAEEAYSKTKVAAVDLAKELERTYDLIIAGDDSPAMKASVEQYKLEVAEARDSVVNARVAYEEALQKKNDKMTERKEIKELQEKNRQDDRDKRDET